MSVLHQNSGVIGKSVPPTPRDFLQPSRSSLRKSFGCGEWISQYLPRLGGARIHLNQNYCKYWKGNAIYCWPIGEGEFLLIRTVLTSSTTGFGQSSKESWVKVFRFQVTQQQVDTEGGRDQELGRRPKNRLLDDKMLAALLLLLVSAAHQTLANEVTVRSTLRSTKVHLNLDL